MIKLQIVNWFQKPEDYEEIIETHPIYGNFYFDHDFDSVDYIKPYDQEKWRDGKEYEFNTLKELKAFTDVCEIGFKDKVKDSFSSYDWLELDKSLLIDDSEDNKMKFIISCHWEFRD